MAITLFKKCLGLNDSRAFGTQKMITDPRDPRIGEVELIDCSNLTITSDGSLEKIAPLVPVLTHGSAITNISAGSRFFFQDGIDVNEWTGGTTVVNRFPILEGQVAHTPIDSRVSTTTKVYRSKNAAPTMEEAIVGVNPNPTTSKSFYQMPAFDHAFVYGVKLYIVNHADPRFLQYSEDYGYDLYAVGDNHIGSTQPILEAGAITGSMITTHAEGVSLYAGTGPHDFAKRYYPCGVLDNTLYSGFVSKAMSNVHVWLCDDGVYMVDPSGAIVNLTVNQIENLSSLNTLYYCSTVQDGKYLAFGDRCTVEYDFLMKTFLKRDSFGITSAAVWKKKNYFSSGSVISTYGDNIDTTGNFGCSLTLPFSDMSSPGKKSFEVLYFSGSIDGDVVITATDQLGVSWEKEVSGELINVSNYRIKTPRGLLGNHISIKIESTSGAFRLEELTATFSSSKRSK